jgi:glycosyltransferase involved in cell wall biosynthesis
MSFEAETARASVIIPAHNEQGVITRLLDRFVTEAHPAEYQVVVVCNGCTDATFDVASKYGADIQVIDVPEPSKAAALARGDEVATCFPRIYIDADVEIGPADLRSLVAALDRPGVLAAAPVRHVPRDGVSPLVRAYYRVWEQLPNVQSSLFGRGVIAVSAAGYGRTRQFSGLMADDLAMSEAFAPGERAVVPTARVTVHPPRTLRDLVRRRVRVQTGNVQFERVGSREIQARTTMRELFAIAHGSPILALQVSVFVGVAVIARMTAFGRARTGNGDTWLRDESSRRG